MMWCPKPKGKVIRRPKPTLKQRCRAAAAVTTAAVDQQEKSDPHRDIRYFRKKHSDITRIFFVDSTNSVRECPTGPFEKKQTDITAYLEHAIPSHAAQPASITGQQTRVQGKRNELGDIRACYPCRLPSACNNPTSTARNLKRDQPSAAGAHQNENIRPTTAPTGEMRRLSAANSASAGHTPVPSTVRSGTAGSKRTSCSKPGSVQTSRPGTMDSGLGFVQSSTRGSALGSLQCSSRLMSGTSCAFGSRLQSVPE